MQKTVKIAAGSAAALALLIAGGVAIASPAQAARTGTSTSVAELVDAHDTDNVQNEVEDGTNDGESADDATEVEDGTEDTSDDVNGVEVEDGQQD